MDQDILRNPPLGITEREIFHSFGDRCCSHWTCAIEHVLLSQREPVHLHSL